MIKKITFTNSVVLSLMVNIQVGLAQTVNLEPNVPNAVKGPDTATLVTNVVNTLSFIAGVASVIAIIIGGIMYATSAGDEKRVQNAKNTILYAVVGIIIALLAWGISSFVVSSIT